MKKQRGVLLPVVLGLLMIGTLASVLFTWEPHSEGSLGAGIVALGCGIYALVSAIQNYRRENWRRFVVAVVLLAVCALVCWVAGQIPFCPECDGGTVSPLMRWLLADKL